MRFAAQLADADYGWAYVIVGWTLTGAVLAAYFARLAVRIRACGADAPAGVRTVTDDFPVVPPPKHRTRVHRRRRWMRPRGRRRRRAHGRALRERRVLPDGLRGGQQRPDQGTDRFRLAGAVVPGSIDETAPGRAVRPDRRQEDRRCRSIGVTRPSCSRRTRRSCAKGAGPRCGAGAPFDSDRIMIKHGNEYEAPKVDTKHAPTRRATES